MVRHRLAVLAVLWACGSNVPVVEVQGECADAFQAQLCTWARMQGTRVVAVGLTVPTASIDNAPAFERTTSPDGQGTLTLEDEIEDEVAEAERA